MGQLGNEPRWNQCAGMVSWFALIVAKINPISWQVIKPIVAGLTFAEKIPRSRSGQSSKTSKYPLDLDRGYLCPIGP
jgi:hypothetical protein